MTGDGTERARSAAATERDDTIALDSRIEDLVRVPAWIESLAQVHGIPDNIAFAMNLCMEEALSNVVRHGYGDRPGFRLWVNFSAPREGWFELAVEDEAPHFDPLGQPPPPAYGEHHAQIGGQGIRLMNSFAQLLQYEPTATGNRLRFGFCNAPCPK